MTGTDVFTGEERILKKMILRKLAIVLGISVVLTALGGCAGMSQGGSSFDTAETVSEETDAQTETEEASVPEEVSEEEALETSEQEKPAA